MAIKDQCSGCLSYNMGTGTCQRTGNTPSFDYRSCEDYKKKFSINLDKGDSSTAVQPSQPVQAPAPVPSPAPSAPSQPSGSGTTGGQGMFAHPFSFQGRIRRTEFCLSYLIYMVWSVIYSVILESDSPALIIPGLIFLIPASWFFLAQGAKRCHDRDNSGIFLFVPFYILWMMFGEGDHGRNSYGDDPKA